jgi:predicted CopG family antitoxin
MTDKRLAEAIEKLKREKKDDPFTTSIRIDRKLYDKVFNFLDSQGITFSDFINEYLKSAEKDIDNLKKEGGSSKK